MQIHSAIPEIFDAQTKKKTKKSQTALKTEPYLRAVNIPAILQNISSLSYASFTV